MRSCLTVYEVIDLGILMLVSLASEVVGHVDLVKTVIRNFVVSQHLKYF